MGNVQKWESLKKIVLSHGAMQVAFVAISSRIVGSTFRCLETLNPKLQQSKANSDPRTVCMRELSSLAMSWFFSLGAHSLLKPWADKRNWGGAKIQFLTAVIGTTIAESMGRLIAYRKLYAQQNHLPVKPPQIENVPGNAPPYKLEKLTNWPPNLGEIPGRPFARADASYSAGPLRLAPYGQPIGGSV